MDDHLGECLSESNCICLRKPRWKSLSNLGKFFGISLTFCRQPFNLPENLERSEQFLKKLHKKFLKKLFDSLL